jgi:hypothetical protein
VYRRLRVNDGAYGTYQAFQTIIERYKVRIYPDQHQLRERVPLGEQQRGNAYKALANPSHNGKTVMIGDVFHDVKNNECYDVVAAPRPRAGLTYGAMIQYGLTIVKDGCPPPATVPYETTAPPGGAGGAGATQTHFIMRPLANNEIFGWQALPYFDGLIYNLQFDDPLQLAEIAALVAAGRRWWRYYTILDYPFSGTLFGGTTPPLATWFNYLRDNVQFSGSTSHRRFRVGNTVALFNATPAGPQPEQRELIPHGLIIADERAALVAQMVALALAPGGLLAPASGVFLDQAWLNLPSFFVESNPLNESGHGNVKEGSPKLTALDYAATEAAFGEGGTWATHRAGLMALYTGVATALGATRYAIKNGEHVAVSGDSIPKPWLFENAWNNNADGSTQPERWANAKAGFLTDPRNILSIKCHDVPNAVQGVPEAIAHWQENGGWIGFTDDDSAGGIANRETAYAEVAALLAARGFPSG